MRARIELNPGDWIVWVTPDDPKETESPLFVADNGIDLYFTYAPADYPWTRMRGPKYEPTADARQVEAVLNGELQWPHGTFYKSFDAATKTRLQRPTHINDLLNGS